MYGDIALSVCLPMKQVTHTGHTTSRQWRYHVYNLVLAAGMMVFTTTNMNLLLVRPPATNIKHRIVVVVVPCFLHFLGASTNRYLSITIPLKSIWYTLHGFQYVSFIVFLSPATNHALWGVRTFFSEGILVPHHINYIPRVPPLNHPWSHRRRRCGPGQDQHWQPPKGHQSLHRKTWRNICNEMDGMGLRWVCILMICVFCNLIM